MDRYDELEQLEAHSRREMVEAARRQYAPFRLWASRLAKAALRESDAAFLQRLLDRDLEREPRKLLRQASSDPLAAALERAMATALLSGIARHPAAAPRRRSRLLRAGQGRRCGESWIPQWKTCRLEAGSVEDIIHHIREGHTGPYTAQGKPLSAKAYGMVKKHAPSLSRHARPTAHEQDIRHILKNHARELTAADWASVLAGPQPGDTIRPSRTEGGNPAIEVWTPRGDRWLQKVYRIERAALAIHTMKRKKEK